MAGGRWRRWLEAGGLFAAKELQNIRHVNTRTPNPVIRKPSALRKTVREAQMWIQPSALRPRSRSLALKKAKTAKRHKTALMARSAGRSRSYTCSSHGPVLLASRLWGGVKQQSPWYLPPSHHFSNPFECHFDAFRIFLALQDFEVFEVSCIQSAAVFRILSGKC